MIRMKGGFTLIEVSLFLAITGLLFLGVTIGVQNSVFQQRYNDSVQNFVEFLRSAYAKTENVQRTNDGGNTDKAIYGKLITFGEEGSDGEITMYDVIGNANCGSGFNGTLEALAACDATVTKEDSIIESYRLKWSAAIQDVEFNPFVGAVLITRHPQSGTIHTFVKKNGTVQVNKGDSLAKYLDTKNDASFKSGEIDFCINPNGYTESGSRRNVHIEVGARNSLGIEIMSDDKNYCDLKG